MAKQREKGSGCLKKLKGCRFWYAQWYDHDGKAVRVSTRTEVKQEALDFLRREMNKRDEGFGSLADLKKAGEHLQIILTAGILAIGVAWRRVQKQSRPTGPCGAPLLNLS